MIPPFEKPIEIVTSDGIPLDGRLFLPQGKPSAALFLGHAMMVDVRTLDRPRGRGLASTLASRGIAVATVNFRGHGTHGPRAGEKGFDWTYDDLVAVDMPAIAGFLESAFPGLPKFLGGHSLAGHVSLAAAASGTIPRPAGWVGFASNVWGSPYEPSAARWAVKRVLVEAFGIVTAAEGRFNSRRFGMGPAAESRSYVADLRRFCRTGRWMSRDGRNDYAALLRGLDVPVYSVTGTADRWFGDTPSVRAFLQGAGARQVHVEIGDRGAAKASHMGIVLNPEFRDEWLRVADWILATR